MGLIKRMLMEADEKTLTPLFCTACATFLTQDEVDRNRGGPGLGSDYNPDYWTCDGCRHFLDKDD